MIANCARFGLEASNWSHNANRPLTVGRRYASGARVVNAFVASDRRLRFDGAKRSGMATYSEPPSEFRNAGSRRFGASLAPTGRATE